MAKKDNMAKAGKEAKAVQGKNSKQNNPANAGRTGTKSRSARSSRGAAPYRAPATNDKASSAKKPKKRQMTARELDREFSPKQFRVMVSDQELLSGTFVSMECCEKIARFDLVHAGVSSDPRYVQDNRWQYFYGINLWLHMVYDTCQNPAFRLFSFQVQNGATVMRELRDYISYHGLLSTIRDAKRAANAVINGERPKQLRFLTDGFPVRVQLQNLRFLKRFTPLDCDLLYNRAVSDWLAVEKKTRSHNHRNYVLNTKYDYVMSRVRVYLANWCKRYRPIDRSLANLELVVPTGAAFDPTFDLNMRLCQILQECHDRGAGRFYSLPTPNPWAHPVLPPLRRRKIGQRVYPYGQIDWSDGRCVWHEHAGRYLHRFNRLITVPKTADSPRIVCPEQPLNQVMQRLIRDNLEKAVPAWVQAHLPCRDQDVMVRACEHAYAEHLTTTDLSHASDSLAYRHVLDAFPSHLARDLQDWRPTHTKLPDGSIHLLQQFSTMGTGNVWYIMALFLLACECVACDLVGVPASRKNKCYAFGDDLIHPDEIRDCLYFILGMFGFSVNEEKSYTGDHPYRESCGAEFYAYCGKRIDDVRTLYYPRFPVHCRDGKPVCKCHREYDPKTGSHVLTDTLARFVDLQKKLFKSYPTASDFLTQCILQMEPRMTTSVAGTICSDLWGHMDKPIVRHLHGLFDGPIPVYLDEETGLEKYANAREGHLCPVVVSGKPDAEPIVEEWKYVQFLRNGPTLSSDPVLAAIGCTEPSNLADPRELTIKWVVKF